MVNYSKTQGLFSKEPKKSPDLKYKDTFPAGFLGEEMAEESTDNNHKIFARPGDQPFGHEQFGLDSLGENFGYYASGTCHARTCE
jgi:hypothetical protein